jgi:hypothetical protein
VKFGMEMDHEHTYILCVKWLLYIRIKNMAVGRNFEVTFKKFNGNGIFRPT